MGLIVSNKRVSEGTDSVKVDEVILFAENNRYCYDILITVYLSNLQKKWVKGNYDKDKAIKLLEYFYSNYVRRQIKKSSEYGYDPQLNVSERKLFGIHFRDYLVNEFLNHIKVKK